MKKAATKEAKAEFLYPGDVWSGILGKDYKDKLMDFIQKGVSEGKYKDMKIIHNNIYTFMEWKPDNSPMAFEAVLEDVVENGRRKRICHR